MNEIENAKQTAVELPKETSKAPEIPREPASNQPSSQNNIVPQSSSPRRFKVLKIILKIILGIATFLPIIALMLCVPFILLFGTSGIASIAAIFVLFVLVFTLGNFVVVFYIILELIYILIVFKNRRISKNKKAIWAVMFSLGIFFSIFVSNFFLNLKQNFFPIHLMIYVYWLTSISLYGIVPTYIAMPIYWYLYIWKEPKKSLTEQK